MHRGEAEKKCAYIQIDVVIMITYNVDIATFSDLKQPWRKLALAC